MNYCVFSENEWVYPDSRITEEKSISLYSARNADVCFQVLTDKMLVGGEAFSCTTEGLAGEAVVYQLMPAHVGENSDAKLFTTLDYESVKHFVTRQAPFDVYEITRPLEDGSLWQGRAAFYVRINIASDAEPGCYEGRIVLKIGEESLFVPVTLKIYKTVIPSLKNASFHMINWIYFNDLAKMHGASRGSDQYKELLEAYFENQLDMRNDYLMIPSGEPVRDASGYVVDFDFSHAAMVGNMALERGFKYILGGFVARFKVWDEEDHYLLWDRNVGVTTLEGFRQLKLYFQRAWECVEKNGWQKQYMQCLVDEPQFPNSLAYRALSGICRSQMPGIRINDPVETTDIYGAVDVWVVKQAIYEKYLDTYRALQNIGEEVWLYTCGFPSGSMMNRVIDLPLTVSRLPIWLCFHYQCPGFLHWGYHYHNAEVEKETCFRRGDQRKYPAGNSFVVYPARDGALKPWYSVRGHSQRLGAYDYELFHLLAEKYAFEKADALICKVCSGFEKYDPSAILFDQVRHELLEMLG